MTDLVLPLPPSVNALYRNLPHGRGRAKTERYNTWLNAAGYELLAQRPKRVKGDYILWLWCQRPDRRRRDLGNLEKAVSDLLTAHGVIADDSMCSELHIYWSGTGRECRVRVEAASSVLQPRKAA